LDIKKGKYYAVSKKPDNGDFPVEYVSARVKYPDSTWANWIKSYDERNSVVVNQDSNYIIMHYEKNMIRLEIMNTDMPDSGRGGKVWWLCRDKDSDHSWCGVLWDFSNKKNTITLTSNDMQLCYYIK